jgi:hypothetical protein
VIFSDPIPPVGIMAAWKSPDFSELTTLLAFAWLFGNSWYSWNCFLLRWSWRSGMLVYRVGNVNDCWREVFLITLCRYISLTFLAVFGLYMLPLLEDLFSFLEHQVFFPQFVES